MVGSWTFRSHGGVSMLNDLGHNHGTLKGGPVWERFPFEPYNKREFFINGARVATTELGGESSDVQLVTTPQGTQQLTIGNMISESRGTCHLTQRDGFHGELDELRIWNAPRTRENVLDSMFTRLGEIPKGMAVYLPFDDDATVTGVSASALVVHQTEYAGKAILRDASENNWHITPLTDSPLCALPTYAPVG